MIDRGSHEFLPSLGFSCLSVCQSVHKFSHIFWLSLKPLGQIELNFPGMMLCEVLYNSLSFCFWLDETLTIFYSEITLPNDLQGGTNHVCSPQNENLMVRIKFLNLLNKYIWKKLKNLLVRSKFYWSWAGGLVLIVRTVYVRFSTIITLDLAKNMATMGNSCFWLP